MDDLTILGNIGQPNLLGRYIITCIQRLLILMIPSQIVGHPNLWEEEKQSSPASGNYLVRNSSYLLPEFTFITAQGR